VTMRGEERAPSRNVTLAQRLVRCDAAQRQARIACRS
jgi:hypothetical protein